MHLDTDTHTYIHMHRDRQTQRHIIHRHALRHT